jgi:hypothetical protein
MGDSLAVPARIPGDRNPSSHLRAPTPLARALEAHAAASTPVGAMTRWGLRWSSPPKITSSSGRAGDRLRRSFIALNSASSSSGLVMVAASSFARFSSAATLSGSPNELPVDLPDAAACTGVRFVEGAAAAIRFALLPDDGPSGGFFSPSGPEPW